MNDGKVVIGTELDTKQFDAQIKSLELELESIDKRLSEPKKYGLSKDDIADLTVRAEKLNNKLKDLYDRREKLNNQPSKLAEWSEGFGQSLTKNIAKVGRLALGIFGIRTAYNAVRNAMSIISENDEQLKADIDYMKNTLAYVLEPVVRRIVDLFKTLMFYIGYIAKAWFGVNIYAKASQKALASGAKSAKEIRKQLAGFDEMNVLQNNTSSGTGGGGVAPSFDLSDFDNMPIPKWLEWLGKHGEEIIPIIAGIGGALVAMRTFGLEPIRAMGIGIAIWGIVNAIREINGYIKDPSWKHFANTLMYIGIAITGIGVAFSNLPTIIVGAGIAIVGATVKIWDELHEGIDKYIKRLENFSDYIELTTDTTTRNVYDAVIGTIRFLYNGIEFYMTSLKMIFDGIINFITGVFTGNWEKAWTGVVQIFSGILGVVVAVFQNSVGVILKLGINLAVAMAKSIGDTLKKTINVVLQMIEGFVNTTVSAINRAISLINAIPGVKIGMLTPVHLPRLAQGGIVNNPGPGVMMGSYVAGERGAEAVLPLTDDTLQRLANMIPITVNLTNTMNGRVISREIQKVQNENAFAFNR